MIYKVLPSKMSIDEINKQSQDNLNARRKSNYSYEKWLFGGTRQSEAVRNKKKKRFAKYIII